MKRLHLEGQPARPAETEAEASSWRARRAYLLPARYFHFYLFRERERPRTCWLPEGYDR